MAAMPPADTIPPAAPMTMTIMPAAAGQVRSGVAA
jgi:hypothetical protein